MRITKQLKSQALKVNQACYIVSVVVGVFYSIGQFDTYRSFFRETMDMYTSSGKAASFFAVLVTIGVIALFSTLWYYLVKIFVTSKDVVEDSVEEKQETA